MTSFDDDPDGYTTILPRVYLLILWFYSSLSLSLAVRCLSRCSLSLLLFAVVSSLFAVVLELYYP